KQDHLSLPPETGADVIRGGIAENLAGQILRRIQQQRCRWRNDCPHERATPDELLQMRRKRDRIYGRCDYCADFFVPQGVDQLVHPRGVIAGKFNAKRQTTILGGGGEPASHALHELSLIVLCEGENLLEGRSSPTG